SYRQDKRHAPQTGVQQSFTPLFAGYAPGTPQQHRKKNYSADTEPQRGDIPQAQFARHAKARHHKPAGKDQNAEARPAKPVEGFAGGSRKSGYGHGSDGGILDGVGKL